MCIIIIIMNIIIIIIMIISSIIIIIIIIIIITIIINILLLLTAFNVSRLLLSLLSQLIIMLNITKMTVISISWLLAGYNIVALFPGSQGQDGITWLSSLDLFLTVSHIYVHTGMFIPW